MKQGWVQTLGGLAVLTIIPVLTVLCLSPDVHDWVRTSVTTYFRGQGSSLQEESNNASERIKHYRLPDAISKIAEVSEEEPELSKSASASPNFSRAILRLQRALRDYPSWSTKDVFRAVNGGEDSTKAVPCPFERINGEQSVVLTGGEHGVPLTETLNRCAAAVEQMTGQER